MNIKKTGGVVLKMLRLSGDKVIKGTLALLLVFGMAQSAHAFTHPGIQNTQADLDRIKSNLNTEPYKTWWASVLADNHSSSHWTPHPVVNETYGNGEFQIQDDSWAAANNALIFYMTGNTVNRDEAKKIIDAWTGTLKTFDVTDHLAAAPGAYGFSEAGELLRYENGGMTSTEITNLKNMLKNLLKPALETPGNGDGQFQACGHGTTQLKGLIALAVFCDDQSTYNYAVNGFNWNQGTWVPWSCAQYIDPSGQVYESGRDQAHAVGAVTDLLIVAQIAYNQGTDLFPSFNNRLKAAGEFAAKYNLYNDVNAVTWTSVDGNTHTYIAGDARGPSGLLNSEILMRHYTDLVWTPQYYAAAFPLHGTFIDDNSGQVPSRTYVAPNRPVDAEFWSLKNFSGAQAHHSGPGSYTSAQMLSQLSIAPQSDPHFSIKIPAGWSVTLYDADNFGGNSQTFTADMFDTQAYGWDNRVASVKVSSSGGRSGGNVTVYTAANYGGSSASHGAGSYTDGAMGIPNRSMYSLRAPSGYFVSLYGNGGFTGQIVFFTGDYADLSSGGINFANQVSSFRVDGAATAAGAVPNGTYQIVNRNSGKLAEVAGASTANGGVMDQFSNNGGTNQVWRVVAQGSGQYEILNVNSGKALEVPGSSTTDGVQLDQSSWNGGNNQKWTFTATSGGYYTIKNVNSGQAMNVSGSSTADGAKVDQWPDDGGTAKQWQLVSP